MSFFLVPDVEVSGDLDLQLVNVIVFDVDIEAVLLQQTVHTELQSADVLLHLVVVKPCERDTAFKAETRKHFCGTRNWTQKQKV